jgi:hypothetical protein
MQELDPRIVKVSITINNTVKTYQNVAITARGMRYGNPLQNECEVTIFNVKKSDQDYILTETSPYNLNRTPKTVTVEAGRESYGTTKVYVGNIVVSTPSQPPDIGITLKCLTGNFLKGQFLTLAQPGTATLSQMSQQMAGELNANLIFQATDKNLTNYSYNGATLKTVDFLQNSGGLNVFLDNDNLVVKNIGEALTNTLKLVSAKNGMIGIPQLTERGVRVKFLLDKATVLGGGLKLESEQYPTVNGNYIIYKLGFEIANRDVPFYYIAECLRT